MFGHYSVGLSNRQPYAGQVGDRVCGGGGGGGGSGGGTEQGREEGREAKAANEGREMTAIQQRASSHYSPTI